MSLIFPCLDGLIQQAEEEGVKLVFLWFGLWKNGMSTYVPDWVKQDRGTYFFMRDRWGKPVNAVSPLCQAGVERDAAAFTALMSHLKEFDVNRTVLMVQVENEMGLLGDCRDFSPAAEKAYAEAVPTDAADFCGVNGTWDEAFGEEAPELFMTYHYAKATQQIAAAGQGGLSHSALRQRLVGAASLDAGNLPRRRPHCPPYGLVETVRPRRRLPVP